MDKFCPCRLEKAAFAFSMWYGQVLSVPIRKNSICFFYVVWTSFVRAD